MKLRFKLALAMLFVGLIALTVASIAFFTELKQDTLTQQVKSLEQLSAKEAADISQILIERGKAALGLGNSPLIIRALEESNAELASLSPEDRTDRIASLDRKWIATKEASDPFIQSYLANPTAVFLKRQQSLLPGEYGEIFLTNRYGSLVASTAKLTTLAHGHKYWWRGAYAQGRGRVFLDDRGYDDSVGGYVLGLVVPIKQNGRIIGLLKCNLNIMGFISQALSTPRNADLFQLVRSGGLIVFEPGHEPLNAWAAAPPGHATGRHRSPGTGQGGAIIFGRPVAGADNRRNQGLHLRRQL